MSEHLSSWVELDMDFAKDRLDTSCPVKFKISALS